jgi:hypothetical protein
MSDDKRRTYEVEFYGYYFDGYNNTQGYTTETVEAYNAEDAVTRIKASQLGMWGEEPRIADVRPQGAKPLPKREG